MPRSAIPGVSALVSSALHRASGQQSATREASAAHAAACDPGDTALFIDPYYTTYPGTIRGDFSISRQMNLVHASDGPESAAREIDLFFDPSEIVDDEPTLRPWLRAADE